MNVNNPVVTDLIDHYVKLIHDDSIKLLNAVNDERYEDACLYRNKLSKMIKQASNELLQMTGIYCEDIMQSEADYIREQIKEHLTNINNVYKG